MQHSKMLRSNLINATLKYDDMYFYDFIESIDDLGFANNLYSFREEAVDYLVNLCEQDKLEEGIKNEADFMRLVKSIHCKYKRMLDIVFEV